MGRRSLPALLYASLDVSGPPRAADAIVVLAGRRERKELGLDLWRSGFAPALVLSVGRFEWRGLPELGLPPDLGGLAALVAQTPPVRRHFLITLQGESARAAWIPRGRLGTWSEALAIVRLARERGWGALLAVTTAAHSRRVRWALRRAARGSEIRIAVTSVPDARSSVRSDTWWRIAEGRSLVLGEWIKLPLYRFLARG